MAWCDPLVGDLEPVQIPLPDPPWSSSPLIRGPLVLYSVVACGTPVGPDTQRRLEDSRAVSTNSRRSCERSWGLPDIHLVVVCWAQFVAPLAVWSVAGESGGDEETRTPDPLLAKEMLFQLSYVPNRFARWRSGGRTWTRTRDLGLIRAAL